MAGKGWGCADRRHAAALSAQDRPPMGLADRDYARSQPPPPSAGSFLRRRPGAVPLISVNTWLIIINIAVFLVANELLGRHTIPLDQGVEPERGVTSDRASQGIVDWQHLHKHPERPGVFYHEVLEPLSGPGG